jgi:D-glycero-alpha-D-manno-heptose 1-phosphate guanylyltransferase
MKEVIILAGGYGTRLKSITNDLPKCLAEVAGKPFICYVIESLLEFDYNHFILSLGYKSNEIKEFILANFPGLNFTFSVENEPLLTGGAIRLSMEYCKTQDILVVNADTLFAFNLNDFHAFYLKSKADISLALKQMQKIDRYGVVNIDDNQVVKSFEEKKYIEKGYINCGYLLIKKNLILQMPINFPFSFETDFLLKNLEKLRITAFIDNAYFIDIGIPEDYNKANIDLEGITSIKEIVYQ